MKDYQAFFTRNEDGWWTAQCVEVPAAITQGRTIEEARRNLKCAINEMIRSQRDEMVKDAKKQDVLAVIESVRA